MNAGEVFGEMGKRDKAIGRQLWRWLGGLSIAAVAGATAPPPRAAQSVTVSYPAPPAVAFCNSVEVLRAQRGSYFQMCGFSHGYGGLQEVAGGQRVLIFSVWDPAPAHGERSLPHSQRVRTLFRATDVRVSRFGGEGTGEHLFFAYPWRLGRIYHMAVTARAIGRRTAYTAWFYLNHQHRWKRLATFSTLAEKHSGLISGGGEGYYAFIEDFRRNFKSARRVRHAIFGPAWFKTADRKWHAAGRAVFQASHAPWEARHAIAGQVIGDRISLETGGSTRQNIAVGTVLRPKPPNRVPKLLDHLPRR